MTERRSERPSPSRADGEGLRVIAKTPPADSGRRLAAVCIAAAIAVTLAGWWWQPASVRSAHAAARVEPRAETDRDGAAREGADRGGTAVASTGRAPSRAQSQAASQQEPPAVPSSDPDDLAAYFQPGDPEPSGAQVIQALQQAGVRTGLGAFNPPGTSPPLLGLAVPEDYELPTGYVRHHQVTDEGVAIEPVLMFAPGFVLRDARGRPVAMPQDRIVPPELAPPGLPLRPIRIPQH